MKVPSRVASVAAAAGIASLTYQRIAEARDHRRFPPPGRLVDIGGRRLHLVDAGEGSPAVVIIPALADNVLQWLGVLEGAAAEARVCLYDRAGIGWSDAPPRGRHTPATMASDLYALLQAAGIPPPYVLVGHSLGGVIGRRFQADYPQAGDGNAAGRLRSRGPCATAWRDGLAGGSLGDPQRGGPVAGEDSRCTAPGCRSRGGARFRRGHRPHGSSPIRRSGACHQAVSTPEARRGPGVARPGAELGAAAQSRIAAPYGSDRLSPAVARVAGVGSVAG